MARISVVSRQGVPRGAWAPALLVAALVGAALLWAGLNRAGADLEVRVAASANTSQSSRWLQVMHAADGAFLEPASAWTQLPPDPSQPARLRLPADELRWLRLDFALGTGPIRLCGGTVRLESGGMPLHLAYSIAGANQVSDARFDDAGCLAARIDADANDPYVVLRAHSPQDLPSRSAVANVRRAVGLGILMLVLAAVGSAIVASGTKPGGRLAALAHRAFATLDTRLHWLALAALLGFGAIHALAGPPNYTPDEGAHLSKVARMHAGHPFDGGSGSLLPHVTANLGPFGDMDGNTAVLDPQVLTATRSAPLRCAPEARDLPAGANAYFPHVYSTTWVVFAAACGMDASFGRFLALARLLNLLLAAGLVSWGIAMAGPLRWPLAAVALLPMAMAQYASVSADALTLSMAFAAVGGLAGAAAGRRPLRTLRGPLLLLALGLALAKPGAPWVLAIALLAWVECRRQGVSYLGWTVSLVALPALVHLGWTLWASSEAAVITRDVASGNRDLLLQDPGHFLGMMWHAYTPPVLDSLWRGAIGQLGWLDIDLDRWAYTLGTTAIGATLLLGGRMHPGAAWRTEAATRAFALLVAIGSLVLVALPLYLYWTDPAGTYVQGLQGRYFLPTIAVLAAFASTPAPILLRLGLAAFVLLAVFALNVEGVTEMLDAYYVSGRRP